MTYRYGHNLLQKGACICVCISIHLRTKSVFLIKLSVVLYVCDVRLINVKCSWRGKEICYIRT